MLEKFLRLLSGRKGSIASVIGLVVSYLATKSILDEASVVLIMGLSLVFFGTASYKTAQLYKK